jgi:hypothetical protein
MKAERMVAAEAFAEITPNYCGEIANFAFRAG